MPAAAPDEGAPTPRRRHVARWVVLGVVALVLVGAGSAAWAAKGALTARDELTAALTDVPTVEDALRGGDTDAAGAALARVQEHTSRARHATSGPVWALASVVPGVSADASALRTATRSVDDLAQDVLPPLVEAAGTVDVSSLAARDGRVDLGPLERAAPLVQTASDRLVPLVTALDGIDPTGLHDRLAQPVAELRGKVAELDGTVATVHRATALLPAMLGADGTRHYLLLSMNSAELRSLGGIPGSITELEATDGAVRIVRSASSGDLGPWDSPVAAVPAGDKDLFGELPALFPQDTTMSPDFPTAARLSAAMWAKAGHGTVDGVLATDTVALSHVLGATGPVDVEGRSLTADDAVDVLLSQVYAEIYDNEGQDAFFAAASRAVFTRLMSGGASASALQPALTQAADEHRLLVWSSHPGEQALLQDTELSGDLTGSDRGRAALGVFLNDGTGGKMDYYLRSSVSLVASECRGTTRFDTVDVTLRSDAPQDAATSLQEFVTGQITGVVAPGVIRTNLTVYTPVGVGAPVLTIGDRTVGGDTFTAWDRAETQLTQDLRPGQKVTVRLELATPASAARADAPGTLDVWSTPTTTSSGLSALSVATCP